MNDAEDRAYSLGYRVAFRELLSLCLRELGEEGDAHRWRAEREDTVNALRALCVDLGCNDWPSELHLADVITKHLAPAVQALDDFVTELQEHDE